MTPHTLKSLTLLLLVSLPSFVHAGNSVESKDDLFITWIDREWEYRYLLVIDEGWQGVRKVQQRNWIKNPEDIANQQIAAYFDPTLILVPESKEVPGWGEITVLRLDVARDRTVQTATLQGKIVEARLNRLRRIVLAPKGETPPSFTIRFGSLFLGAYYAADPAYSPSICTDLDMEADYHFNGRYQEKFKADTDREIRGSRGYFGCREWAAQLYSTHHPYINVTSYEWGPDISKPKQKGKYPVGAVTYIKPFFGFSRFQDAPKPVIGQHLGQWYCLTDCPEGTSPGRIDDIKSWAATRAWPVPKRPKKVRQYINQTPDFEE